MRGDSCGASVPRSSATNGGGGSGTRSPPGGATVARDAATARARTASRALSASAPSDDGRSPTTTPCRAEAARGPARPSAARACPRPRARGRTRSRPRRRSHPRPGCSPPGDRVGRVEVRRDEPRALAHRRATLGRARRSRSSRWNPTTTASAGGAPTGPRGRRRLERLDDTRARAREHTRLRARACPRAARPPPSALVSTSSVVAVDAAALRACRRHVADRLARVVRDEADPEARGTQRGDRRRPRPGSARRRARRRRRDRSRRPGAFVARRLEARSPTSASAARYSSSGRIATASFRCRARPVTVADAEQAQAEAEVRVVVHGVELERRGRTRPPRRDSGRIGSRRAPASRGSSPCRARGRVRARATTAAACASADSSSRSPSWNAVYASAPSSLIVRHLTRSSHALADASRVVGPCDNRALVPLRLVCARKRLRRARSRAVPRPAVHRAAPTSTAVTAPPYDVIDEDERAALHASHPNNAVRLILPGVGPTASGPTGRGPRCRRRRLRVGRATLAAWRAGRHARRRPGAGALRVPHGGATVRRRARVDTIGVIGALALPAASDHRRTATCCRTSARCRRRKSDRLALLRATCANFDPIWGLTLADGSHRARRRTCRRSPRTVDAERRAATSSGASTTRIASRRCGRWSAGRRSSSPTGTIASRPRARICTSTADPAPTRSWLLWSSSSTTPSSTCGPSTGWCAALPTTCASASRRCGRCATPEPRRPTASSASSTEMDAITTGSASSTVAGWRCSRPQPSAGAAPRGAARRAARRATRRASTSASSRSSAARASRYRSDAASVAASWSPVRPTRRSCCAASASSRSAAPPTHASGCRRRRPTSLPSRAPAW